MPSDLGRMLRRLTVRGFVKETNDSTEAKSKEIVNKTLELRLRLI